MKLLIFSAGVFFVVFDLLPSYAAESHDAHDHKKEATEQASHPGYDPGVDKEKDIHKDEHGHDDKNPSSGSQAHDTHGHDDKEHREQETRTEGKVLLTNEKQRIAGIAVIELQQQSIQQEIILPGEVKANSYATSIVSPRIHAQISQRHARLGQSINKGRPLATLSSVEMAQAQGELIIANREWSRVMKLGSNVVAEKRFLEAQIAQQQAMAKVLAYGMTEKQLDNLLEKGDLAGATGRFDLLAPQNGTVIKDDFVIGEYVDPGRVLFEITDESSMWVESRARPEEATQISNQVPAKIKFQNSWFEGKVIQVQHVIDEETRTLPVRLEVKNKIHLLHPGQFVEVRLKLTGASTVMAVPKAAALRNAEGEWIVFVEDTPGAYRPVDVIPVRTSGDQLIVEGLSPGMRIVTKGAFFLQSELAKSGFDVHNH